jgi:hypothetical protein
MIIEYAKNLFDFVCFIIDYLNETQFLLPLEDVMKEE